MDKNNSHLAGEYFVAAELYRRGYSVGMTIGNAKAIDMFAEKDGKHLSIQVKAIRNKHSVGWPMRSEQVKDNIIYVFVNLNVEENLVSAPDYYICTSEETKLLITDYAKRGILDLSEFKSEFKITKGNYKNNWDKIKCDDYET